jgi:hypothetical protein
MRGSHPIEEGKFVMKRVTQAVLGGVVSVGMAVPGVVLSAGAAYAEHPSSCSSTVQIGGTAHITIGGQTVASVKQFKGCGKNYAYTYVWDSYRKSHRSWTICASIGNHDTRTLEDIQCGSGGEIWSSGARTLSACTQAIGWFPDIASAETSIRC